LGGRPHHLQAHTVVIILLIAAPTIPQLVVLFEGMEADWTAVNARSDILAVKACIGVGTMVDYSVVLQAQGTEKLTTLVKHSELSYD
jgi:hypothetical protein